MDLNASTPSKEQGIANVLTKQATRWPRESWLKWLDLFWDPAIWLYWFAKALVGAGLLFAVGFLLVPHGNEVPTFSQWVGFLRSPTFVVSTVCLAVLYRVVVSIVGELTKHSSQSKSWRKARVRARRLGLYPPTGF